MKNIFEFWFNFCIAPMYFGGKSKSSTESVTNNFNTDKRLVVGDAGFGVSLDGGAGLNYSIDNSLQNTDNSRTDNSLQNTDNSRTDNSLQNTDNSRTDNSLQNTDNSRTDNSLQNTDNSRTDNSLQNTDNSRTYNTTTDHGAVSAGRDLGLASFDLIKSTDAQAGRNYTELLRSTSGSIENIISLQSEAGRQQSSAFSGLLNGVASTQNFIASTASEARGQLNSQTIQYAIMAAAAMFGLYVLKGKK